MQVKDFPLKHLKPLSIIVAFFIAFILFMIFYFPNYTKLRRLRRANDNLTLQVDKLEMEIKDLETKMKKIGKDPYLYEKFARDELGVVREGEIVIDIEE